jgi:hypothetical protein
MVVDRRGTERPVFVKVNWDGRRLSITGVEGPRNDGNCYGGCGQIRLDESRPARGWHAEDVSRLRQVWERWHLNDMRAGCAHQREANWNNARIGEPCQECGYRYGTQWLFEEVPPLVVAFLAELPVSTVTPAWV